MTKAMRLVLTMGVVLAFAAPVLATSSAFDGQVDNQTDAYGYYAAITGGLFVNGQTENGLAASGGVTRYLYEGTDNWWYKANRPPQVWHMDGWFETTAGFALTLKNQGAPVYDNNGIDNGSFPSLFYGDQANPSTVTPGLYVGFSMSNNNDWIYAGRFELTQTTVIDEICGYFAQTYSAEFDYDNPDIRYNMNIFSNVAGTGIWAGYDMPANTGGFAGDVFSSNTASGTFYVEDSGEVRYYSGFSNNDDIIYRLRYVLDEPLVLEPGTYWFNHAPTVVPEPLTMLAVFGGVSLLGGYIRRRRLA